MSLGSILTGPSAFYNQPDYKETTGRELRLKERSSFSLTYNSEHILLRITKLILSIVVFPIGLYQVIHGLAGKAIVPASLYRLSSSVLAKLLPQGLLGSLPSSSIFEECRAQIDLDGEFCYKRITVHVDGYAIDAMIMGKASTLHNGRWMLHSVGNGDFYENHAGSTQLKKFITKLDSNAILFNNPGVGSSSGFLVHRDTLAKAYSAMLRLLEDKEKGIGAKEIIGYGHSLGAAIQADALQSHTLKKEIKYVFIKKQTFSNLSETAAELTGYPIVAKLIKLFRWNIDCVRSSKQLKASEVILQSAALPSTSDGDWDFWCLGRYKDDYERKIDRVLIKHVREFFGAPASDTAEKDPYFPLDCASASHIMKHIEDKLRAESIQLWPTFREKFLAAARVQLEELLADRCICDDGVISKKVSLAKVLLEEKGIDLTKKRLIGIPERHNDEIANLDFLVQIINESLS